MFNLVSRGLDEDEGDQCGGEDGDDQHHGQPPRQRGAPPIPASLPPLSSALSSPLPTVHQSTCRYAAMDVHELYHQE